MKLIKSKLQQMIKEELGEEYEYDPATDLEEIIQDLEYTDTKSWQKQRPQPDVGELIRRLREVLAHIKPPEGE